MIVHLLCIMASCNCIQSIKSVWKTLLSWHSQKFKLSIGIETLLEKASACQLDSITIKISWDCTINFLACVCFSSFFFAFLCSRLSFFLSLVCLLISLEILYCVSQSETISILSFFLSLLIHSLYPS